MKKILLIDSHEVVRDGIKKIFDSMMAKANFGEAGNAAEARQLARAHDWDVAVLDIALAGLSGLEILKELKQIRPHLPVHILTAPSEEQYARRAFRAGAAGYITKDSRRS